jgi:hypothetical protein
MLCTEPKPQNLSMTRSQVCKRIYTLEGEQKLNVGNSTKSLLDINRAEYTIKSLAEYF